MAETKVAMISSTVRDLPEHREKARDACLRQEFLPSMMENWPSIDTDGVKASLDKVDRADIYIGIFGYRYGYIPANASVYLWHLNWLALICFIGQLLGNNTAIYSHII